MSTKKVAKKTVKKAVTKTAKTTTKAAATSTAKKAASASVDAGEEAKVVKKSSTKKVATKKVAEKKSVTKAAAKTTTKAATKKTATKKTATKKTAAKKVSRKVDFSYYSPLSGSVELAGSFNKWDPAKSPMKKTEDGFWTLEISLAPGKYEYKFVFDGSSWECDPQAPTVDSVHGHNNIIEVK